MGKNQIEGVLLLYVEDDQNIRRVYERYLKRLIKDVIVGTNGEEGLELYKEHQPDLIVTDIKMPIMTGLQMSREIRSLDNEIPIIVTTAHTETEFFQEAIDIGVNTFLLKPVDMVKLDQTIRECANNLILKLRYKEEQRLEQENNKMVALSELLSNIAHQWRQPLAAISAASFNMQFQIDSGQYDGSLFSGKIDNITDCVDYLSKTIDSFRNFVTNNRVTEKFDLVEKIKEAIRIESAIFSSHHIKITMKTTHDQMVIRSFPNEFVQAMINIFNNSIDVLNGIDQSEKEISISLEHIEESIILIIQDTGGGFEDTIIDTVFEPYSTTKHKSMGIGLGLYMAYKVVKDHMEGEIFAYNSVNEQGNQCANIKMVFNTNRVKYKPS